MPLLKLIIIIMKYFKLVAISHVQGSTKKPRSCFFAVTVTKHIYQLKLRVIS